MSRHQFKLWYRKAKKFISKGVSISVTPIGEVEPSPHKDKRFQIVQCTGLKDMEGTLIYEGDILFMKGKYVKVIWLNGSWCCIDESTSTNLLYSLVGAKEGFNGIRGAHGKVVSNKFLG